MAVSSVSEPRTVLDVGTIRCLPSGFGVLPDGRFVMIQKGEEEDEITRYNVVLNWFEELKRRVPNRSQGKQ